MLNSLEINKIYIKQNGSNSVGKYMILNMAKKKKNTV